MLPVFTAVVLIVSLLAAIWDARTRTIPRWLTVPAFALGLGYHAAAGNFLSALAAAVLGLAVGALLLELGAFGGGDAKLLVALGALLGMHLWLWSLEFGLLAAALGALVQVALRGRFWFLPQDLLAIIRGWRQYGLRPHPEHNLDSPGAVTAPFGVAMGIGVLCALCFL